MNFIYCVGIDISKQHLDFALVCGKQVLLQERINNQPAAIKALFTRIKKMTAGTAHVLFCMEHTGIYNSHILELLDKHRVAVWLEAAVKIKRSMGLQRGKSDRVDALRIAQYANKNKEDAILWKPARQVIIELKAALCARRRLLNAKKQLGLAIKEAQGLARTVSTISSRLCSQSLKALQKDIHKADEAIANIIASDEHLKKLFAIISSVDGIGNITAAEVIITTNEFQNITEASQYACYAGVAPFEHSSGSSIRGKSRVSHMANKHVKCLLHMASLSAILCNAELRGYYERKLREGKHKMLVLNAVRNKLIHRIFACVKQNRTFQKNIPFPLVNP